MLSLLCWLTLDQTLCENEGGTQPPFAMDAELLSEVLWAVQTPHSPFPSLCTAPTAPQDPRTRSL